MYLEFFGLKEVPFSVTPDPSYFYLGRMYEEALSSLLYGIGERKGFLMLTGEVGTGKTTLCRAFMEHLDEKVHTALILNSNLEREDLIRAIAVDFGIADRAGGTVEQLENLNRFLLERLSRRENAVLIIDEAQNLPDSSLEQIRLISNLETDREKLLQIVLVGQPELRDKLSQPHLRQLDQRITIRCHLQPLKPGETRDYIRHRLRVAMGGETRKLFTGMALREVFRWSRGYPRLINTLCDRALLAAYAAEQRMVDAGLVRRARKDLDALPGSGRRLSAGRWAVIAIAPILAILLLWELDFARRRLWDIVWRTPGREMTGDAYPVPAAPDKSALSSSDTEVTPPAASRPIKPDSFGIERVSRPDATLNASLATLLRLWNLDYLAEESLNWRIVNFNGRLLQIFFREMDISRQYGVELYALPPRLRTIRTFGLPCLVSYRATPESHEIRYAVLAGLEEENAVVYDPLTGRRVAPLEDWVAELAGPVYYLLRGGNESPLLKPDQRGSAVMSFQESLLEAGYYREVPDGVFGPATEKAVRALQKQYGLKEDGVVGIETRLILSRAFGSLVPRLEDPR